MSTSRKPSEATLKKRAFNVYIDAQALQLKRTKDASDASKALNDANAKLTAAIENCRKLGVPIESK